MSDEHKRALQKLLESGECTEEDVAAVREKFLDTFPAVREVLEQREAVIVIEGDRLHETLMMGIDYGRRDASVMLLTLRGQVMHVLAHQTCEVPEYDMERVRAAIAKMQREPVIDLEKMYKKRDRAPVMPKRVNGRSPWCVTGKKPRRW